MNHRERPQLKDGAGGAEGQIHYASALPQIDAHRIASGLIPEIDIWRVANLMLKRYGDQAEAESAIRSAELAENGDSVGAAVWRRVTDAVGQLANTTPPGPVH